MIPNFLHLQDHLLNFLITLYNTLPSSPLQPFPTKNIPPSFLSLTLFFFSLFLSLIIFPIFPFLLLHFSDFLYLSFIYYCIVYPFVSFFAPVHSLFCLSFPPLLFHFIFSFSVNLLFLLFPSFHLPPFPLSLATITLFASKLKLLLVRDLNSASFLCIYVAFNINKFIFLPADIT